MSEKKKCRKQGPEQYLVVGAAAIFVVVVPLLVVMTPLLLVLAVKLPPVIVPAVEAIVVGVGFPALIDAGVVGALGGTGVGGSENGHTEGSE
jgi:hypothetical protein